MSEAGWRRLENGAGSEVSREAETPAASWTPAEPWRPLARRAKWAIVLLALGVVVDLVALGSDSLRARIAT